MKYVSAALIMISTLALQAPAARAVPMTFEANLNGAAEIPPVTTPGTGFAKVVLYGFPEISGHECALIEGPGSIAGTSYRAGEAGAQATAQSERTRPWLLANRFQAISQASMMLAKLANTELASQWLRR